MEAPESFSRTLPWMSVMAPAPYELKLNVDFILKQSCFACQALWGPILAISGSSTSCLLTQALGNMIIQHL